MARRKEHLIPFEKSERIIHLYDNKTRRRISAGVVCTGLLAVLCLVYCLTIAFFMGYGTNFFMIWGVMAVGFGGVSFLLSRPDLLEGIPLWFRRSVLTAVILAGILFLGTEGFILMDFGEQGQENADYVIVLGAQWKTQGPSYVLKKRLDAAVKYLRENPEAKVIVSGGKGSNEPISEAEGMYGYLVQAGISKERILKEDISRNTHENLRNSRELLDRKNDRVVVVTNNFHVFRAVRIARKLGYEKVEGLAAGSYPAMLPNNLLREFFGVWKDLLMGNM